MKIKSFILLLLVLAFDIGFVNACQKETQQPSKTLIPNANSKATERTATHKITCTGTCQPNEHPDPRESTCEAMLYDGNTGTIECPCTGCVMQVSNQLTRVVPYVTYFNEHLVSKIGTSSNVILYAVEIEDYTNTESVLFEYRIPNSTERGTVMYISKFNAAGERTGPTIEIDCSGGCNNATETCRERYILSTGDAECTCEGTCKMTVTYKE